MSMTFWLVCRIKFNCPFNMFKHPVLSLSIHAHSIHNPFKRIATPDFDPFMVIQQSIDNPLHTSKSSPPIQPKLGYFLVTAP